MNAGNEGLWQIPTQLASTLTYISKFKIMSVVEIGTWTGWTISLIGAYLHRFNPGLQVTTVDIGYGFYLHEKVAERFALRLVLGTSDLVSSERFDLAFIDGDHSYDACSRDYDNVGKRAKICMFHDINDRDVMRYEPNKGGVPRLWKELSSGIRDPDHTVEFTDHSKGAQVMGIGLIVRGTAEPQNGSIAQPKTSGHRNVPI
jgi:hypothetical protein